MGRFHVPSWFAGLPWPIRLALIGGGSLVSAFSSRLPTDWQDVGLYCGLASVAYGVLATAWHHCLKWHEARKTRGMHGLDSWYFIGPCFAIGVVAIGAACFGLGLKYSKSERSEQSTAPLAARNAQQPTITVPQPSAFGFAPLPKATTVQWKDIFGTSRAVDLVFALFLDGKGPSSRSVKLKNAYLQSGVTGEIIQMKVGSTNPLDDTFPVSEANPIPPNGFIRLVAVMNPANPNQGLPNKVFLDNWRQTWFHAVYEDAPSDDILFDEKIMGSYFPELSGPHVTRQSNGAKK